jgi:hypothetical protein
MERIGQCLSLETKNTSQILWTKKCSRKFFDPRIQIKEKHHGTVQCRTARVQKAYLGRKDSGNIQDCKTWRLVTRVYCESDKIMQIFHLLSLIKTERRIMPKIFVTYTELCRGHFLLNSYIDKWEGHEKITFRWMLGKLCGWNGTKSAFWPPRNIRSLCKLVNVHCSVIK